MRPPVRRILLATAVALGVTAAPAAASCLPSSTQSIFDRNPAVVIATVVEQRMGTLTLAIERSLKGDVPTGRLEVANPTGTSIALNVPVGTRLGLGLHASAQGGYGANNCDHAEPSGLTRAAGPRPAYVVGGRRQLLLLDQGGHEQRRITVPGLVTAVARGWQPGVVALRTAAGVATRDVFSEEASFSPPKSVRASRAFRIKGKTLLRDGQRVATLPAGRWTSATSLR
jgi:hypothetical protein